MHSPTYKINAGVWRISPWLGNLEVDIVGHKLTYFSMDIKKLYFLHQHTNLRQDNKINSNEMFSFGV
jgi:hypothetical protein